MKLYEHRKHPLHYFSVLADGKVVRMPREKDGWEKRQTVDGMVKTEQLKEVKATIEQPMAAYIGVPEEVAAE